MKLLLSSLCLFLCLLSQAQDSLKVMSYNLFRFPSAPPANRELILRDILDQYQPDLFMVCELETEVGANLIQNVSLANQADTFDRAVYFSNTSSNSDNLQNMVFFNTRKLTLLGQQIHPTAYRDINQYTFKLNTEEQDTEPIYIEAFVAHLKSSTGNSNKQARLAMVEVFTNALETIINPNSYVLFCGDFNLYTSTEPAYQKIISPDNTIQIIDPIASLGNWNNNPSFSHVHTQSTRVSNSNFGSGMSAGASGGMDDRFDFIMMSENFNTSSDIYYVSDTYKAYGNNGNCFDNDINSPDCDGPYNLELRESLYWMSDHLPVVMTFETNQTFLTAPSWEQKPVFWFNSSNINSDIVVFGINLQKLPTDTKKIYIYNSWGQLVLTEDIGHSQFLSLAIDRFASGLYFARLGNSSNVLKFIKN